MKHREIRERGLVADLFSGDTLTPKPAVIMLGGSEGGKSWSETPEAVGMLALLVEAGFTVLSLAYFGAEGLPESLTSIPLEYFETAFAWLAEQPEVVPHRYALVGGSKGGELALLLGSRCPQVKAVAAFVPASVVFQGLSRKTESSWSYKGRGLPFVAFPLIAVLAALRGMKTGSFLRAYTLALRNRKQAARAAIPVEKINGPVLLISGTEDEMWPSTRMCEQMEERIAAGFAFPYVHLPLEAGHNVTADPRFWPSVTRFLAQEFAGRLASRPLALPVLNAAVIFGTFS